MVSVHKIGNLPIQGKKAGLQVCIRKPRLERRTARPVVDHNSNRNIMIRSEVSCKHYLDVSAHILGLSCIVQCRQAQLQATSMSRTLLMCDVMGNSLRIVLNLA